MMNNNQQGFTLIEALIAIAIFSIGFLAVASMQINALNHTTNARQTTEGMEIASRQAEILQGLPFYPDFEDEDGAAKFNDHADLAEGNNPHTRIVEDYGMEYEVQWTVTDLTDQDHTVLSIHTDNPATDRVVIYKTIRIEVFEFRNNVRGPRRAEMEFLKVCEQDIRS